MAAVTLRKPVELDIECFRRWWTDKALIELTSGNFESISEDDIKKYFQNIIVPIDSYHFMIVVDDKIIGHISLAKRLNNYYELQIVIGDKEYLDKGYGTDAIKTLLDDMKTIGISKIFLEVRPTNARAIKAYEKCGFKSIKIIKHPGNYALPETLRMELENQ